MHGLSPSQIEAKEKARQAGKAMKTQAEAAFIFIFYGTSRRGVSILIIYDKNCY